MFCFLFGLKQLTLYINIGTPLCGDLEGNWKWKAVHFCVSARRLLTVAGHPDGKTFLEPTVLTPVPVEPDDQTLAVPQAPVLDLLLDASSEEALQQNTLLSTGDTACSSFRLFRSLTY